MYLSISIEWYPAVESNCFRSFRSPIKCILLVCVTFYELLNSGQCIGR
jgi:hypothetical protein